MERGKHNTRLRLGVLGNRVPVVVRFHLRVDSVLYRVACLRVQVPPVSRGKETNMLGDQLITAYKENRLDDFIMVCRNRLCDRAINMEFSNMIINRAEWFDTYTFRCPKCSRILAIEFDYKEGEANEINSRTKVQKARVSWPGERAKGVAG